MKRIIDEFRNEKEYKHLLEDIYPISRGRLALAGGLYGTAESVFISALSKDLGGTMVLCAADEQTAMKLRAEISEFVRDVYYFPPREFVLSDFEGASHGWEQIRISALSALSRGKCSILVTTAEALLQKTMPKAVLDGHSITLRYGEDCDFDELCAFLSDSGYSRVDMIDGKSQYAVRGGIVDIFPPFSEKPVRVEFFGNSVDSLAYFEIESQRRLDNIDSISFEPCREMLLDKDAVAKIRAELTLSVERIKEKCEKTKQLLTKERKKNCSEERERELLFDIDRINSTKERVKSAIDRLDAGLDFPFLDAFFGLVYEKGETLFDHLPKNSFMYLKDYKAVISAAESYEFRMREAVESVLEKGIARGEYLNVYEKAETLTDNLQILGGVVQNNIASSVGALKYDGLYPFNIKHGAQGGYDITLLCDDIKHYIRLGYKIYLSAGRKEAKAGLAEMLSEHGIMAHTDENYVPKGGETVIVSGRLDTGYESAFTKTVLLCDVKTQRERLEKKRDSVQRMKQREISSKYKNSTQKIISYADLNVGDYVVHANYGIGIFCGIESISDKNVTKDYIKIKYAGTDVLFVPVGSLDMVSKYIGAGADDNKLKLSKLSTNDWSKAKASVKKEVKQMAEKLVKLYAERKEAKGFSFSPDTEWQEEFEAGFEYEETDGQLAAISEIKADMESASPMDRLLCGDVGFGKTEVALRAAFKAVSDSKQVAILVPTTILAWQHYQTLCARMSGYPIKIELLSRFVSEKKQEDVLRHLKRGDVDIVVGTHRIIQKDIEFKDLGLLIIDEEQRFGVEQKEALKEKFKNVDVLTLSATPIPRTLNMAMSGIRDMSVLDEAPQDRYPVQSYVCEYDDGIVNDAVSKELARGGQVFYLVNRVSALRTVAAKLQRFHPDAVIRTAHGSMDEENLSMIWQSLVAGDTDILVCTTIIETGIDVPNANTLIIENADRMGLSQLHQLRGRVGRSSRRAYAYFTYPTGKTLSEEQTKRLTAIRDYTEFGAGFKIAMRDMEIRGAGNILGPEQHGQISAVGYDLYVKILDEAVRELKISQNDTKAVDAPAFHEVTMDLPISAFIPKNYIYSERMRIDVYRKIAAISSKDEMEGVIDELCDRFSDIPKEVMQLIASAYVKSLAMSLKIDSVKVMEGNLVIFPTELDPMLWGRLASAREYYGRILLSPSGIPHLTYKMQKDDGKNYLKVLEGIFTKAIDIMKENCSTWNKEGKNDIKG